MIDNIEFINLVETEGVVKATFMIWIVSTHQHVIFYVGILLGFAKIRFRK